ncbi:MAG: hypothetical protein MJB14_07295, partial [Spirochaetes bacterium]|nr:hypothetical protein [Spirochaetota bacterium]
KVFLKISFALLVIGTGIGLRFLFDFISGDGEGHIQSLILASIIISASFQLGLFGLLADAISANRKINEELLYRMKKIQYDQLNAKKENLYLVDDLLLTDREKQLKDK